MDDLIPIVAFVLAKSGLTHWTATLAYLQQFVFNDLTDVSEKGADSFLVATLEAAMSYVTELSEKRQRKPTQPTADVEEQKPNDNAVPEFNTNEAFIEYFFEVVRRGDEQEVLRLFRKDKHNQDRETKLATNNNIIDDEKQRAGTEACHPLCSCPECALIVNGSMIDVNLQNIHGINAMHVAAMFGHTQMINVLLALHSDLTLVDENGWTALHYAASQGHQSAVLLLLHAGIAINAKSNDLFAALHLASLNGHEGCVKAILYYAEQIHVKVDLNGITRTGDTALHLAAKWGFSEIVECLLEYGVKVEIPNLWGLTASDCAHNSLIREQLQNMFVIVNDNSWHTGLDETDTAAKPEPFRGCISEEILAGSRQQERRSSSNDKVIAAIRNGDTKLAYYFLGWDDESADTNVSSAGSSEICHPLCTCPRCSAEDRSRNSSLSSNASVSSTTFDVNAANADGITILHAAAQTGNSDLVEFLLAQGARVGYRTSGQSETALHLAVRSKDLTTVSLMLNAVTEFELNVQNVRGDTALHLAVRTGSAPLMELMLRHEPWLDAVNEDKQTPLDVARAAFLFNVCNMLEVAAANSASEDTERNFKFTH